MTKAREAEAPRLPSLLACLDPGRPVAVQAHDYPDIDAVASAWALAALLRRHGLEALPVRHGAVRSRSLSRLIEALRIDLRDSSPGPRAQIVAVDGSPSNGNLSLVEGELAAVIDHHSPLALPEAPYVDIRPSFASCSAMVEGYWKDSGLEPPRDLATALLAGIQSDTDFLSRRASAEDFESYARLYRGADFEQASRIVRSVLDLRELRLAAAALEAAEVRQGLLWAFLPDDCGQEVLAVLADFALRAEELRAAVVAARDSGRAGDVHLSVRSKDPVLSAFRLVLAGLAGLGTGGGHSHSAGGYIESARFPGEEALKERFFALVDDGKKA